MSFDPNTYYHIQPGSGDGCLAALPNRDGSTPFPVRTKSCQQSGDDSIFWRFDPDGKGRYFVYNKAWPGKDDRLDLVLQDTTGLYIPWMGPSGDIYNNQRWSVSKSGGSFQISSFGLPGALLAVTEIPGQSSLGAVLRNDTEVNDAAAAWQVLDVFAPQPDESEPEAESTPESPKPTTSRKNIDQPAPTPTPTTFVTSSLPRSQQNILETDRPGLPPTSSSGLSIGRDTTTPTGTGISRSLTAQPTDTIEGSNGDPTPSSQPSPNSTSSPNLNLLPLIALILLLFPIAWLVWKCVLRRRHQPPVQPRHSSLSSEDMTLPDLTESNATLLKLIRRFSQRINKSTPITTPAGTRELETVTEQPSSGWDTSSTAAKGPTA